MHIAWTSFLVALLIIMIVPGPDFVLIMGNAVRSLKRGTQAALGVITGLIGGPLFLVLVLRSQRDHARD